MFANEIQFVQRQSLNMPDCFEIKTIRYLLFCSLLVSFLSHPLASENMPVAPQVVNLSRSLDLTRLVRQDCGSCHGMTLKGGLGPALLPDSLGDKSSEYLKATIMYGRPGNAMPPWSTFLKEEEVEWIVLKLQRGFPSED